MPYCPECGTEVEDDTKFCPECGSSIQSSTENTTGAKRESSSDGVADQVGEDNEGIETGRAVASGVMGILVGAVVAFAFTNIGGSSILFFITTAGVGYFLYSKQETIKLIIGTGLYITALWLPLSPILFYIPLAGGANSETAAGAGQAIGSILGMFIYGFIALIIGVVLAAVGYFLRKNERD